MVHDTTAGALALKACAPAYQLEGRLIPVPRTLSAGCGMAWCEPPGNKERLEQTLRQEAIEYNRIVTMTL